MESAEHAKKVNSTLTRRYSDKLKTRLNQHTLFAIGLTISEVIVVSYSDLIGTFNTMADGSGRKKCSEREETNN